MVITTKDERMMKPMNSPMLQRRLRSKRKVNRKKAQVRLTYKNLESITWYIIIRTFDNQNYVYYQQDCLGQNGYYAVDLESLQKISLRDLYYHIRNIRVGETTQLIAKRKQPDDSLILQPGMQKLL
ncbi:MULTISPECIES: hypothetical protein [Listeria]|uniref:hypothetical protein n=1 Tax=Listeria TaxID=1637 RepID=UPI000B5953BF|nr:MULTISPECIES: hypothetical protein [Listeria]